jgi:FixJ family two-component response regulator
MTRRRPVIAVVDDDTSVRQALARVLQASEFDVVAFASGQEFLDALETCKPDCLIVDFQMPGLSGDDLLRQLASRLSSLPVIVVTAHDLPTTREQCLESGAVAYLVKPLSRREVIAAIERVIPGL